MSAGGPRTVPRPVEGAVQLSRSQQPGGRGGGARPEDCHRPSQEGRLQGRGCRTGTGHRFGPERPATPADTSCVCPSVNCATFFFLFTLQNFISRFDVGCTVYVSPSIKFKCINQSTSGASKRHNGAQIGSRRNTGGAKTTLGLHNMIEMTAFLPLYLFLNQ